MKNLLALIGLLTVLAGGGYLYAADQGDGDPCRARADMFADQVPPALDLLSARYPLRIGLVRALVNDRGQLDALVRDQASDQMIGLGEEQAKSRLECAYEYYAIWVFRDRVREEIAAALEVRLRLAE
ncbi:MAG: hypothetical protein ACFE0P_14250 [Oceanicaulis sp.]